MQYFSDMLYRMKLIKQFRNVHKTGEVSSPLSAEGSTVSLICLSVTTPDTMPLVIPTAELVGGSWNVTLEFV